VTPKRPIVFSLAVATALFVLSACGQGSKPVPIHVAFKLIDDDNQPVVGMPLRILAGVPNWNANAWRRPDFGVRIVTDRDGAAHFATEGTINRTWVWKNVGFTPLSVPVRVDHAGVGFEIARVLPTKHGDTTHHWLYTAEIYRESSGDSSTYDLDRVYEAGPDGRFTRLLAKSVSSPKSVMMVDGLALNGTGYRLADFSLAPAEGGAKGWLVTLVLKQGPKPVLR